METLEEKIARVVAEHAELVPYDPAWPERFREERDHLRACLPAELLGRIEHMGSTAVPGLVVKPIVDMLVEVTDLEATRERIAPILEAQGYDYFWRATHGEDGPPFYAWFIKRGADGERTHHLHMVEPDFEQWERLLFRDHLIAHPEVADEYARLKRDLVERHDGDRIAYTEAKTEFVREVTERARLEADAAASARPRLYDALAVWWPLLSPPADYAEEAALYASTIERHCAFPARTLLELGSGGGNNACHLKARFEMTLVDVAPAMLETSRALNPECDHVEADMRTVRLGRTFDAVFVHDAVCYMTTHADLRRAVETAWVHCRPGGVALFVPDHVRETFCESTDHGGSDDGERGLRYLEWTRDPDPRDTSYVVDYAYMMRERDGTIRVEHERHVEGLFAREEWLDLLSSVGFCASAESVELSAGEGGGVETVEIFVAEKPAGAGAPKPG